MSAQRELAAPPGRAAWIGWCVPVLAAILLLAVSAPPGAWRAPGLPPAVAAPLPEPRVLREIGKQAVEQPLHFLMAAAPIWLSRSLVGVPCYGWAVAPLLAWREWSQWPSKRWWDPPLDWAFMALGLVVATRRRSRRPLAPPPQSLPRPPSHPLRRKYPSRPAATPSISISASG